MPRLSLPRARFFIHRESVSWLLVKRGYRSAWESVIITVESRIGREERWMRSVGGPRVKSGRFVRGFGGVPASCADVRRIMRKLQARSERECVPRDRNTSSPWRWRQMWGRERLLRGRARKNGSFPPTRRRIWPWTTIGTINICGINSRG